MTRTIPGTQEVKGCEFMYIESPTNESFHQLASSVSTVCPDAAMPQSGGAIEEKVRIKLKSGISLIGVSYKGDLDGWRTRFVGFCEASTRRYGFIKENRLHLSDGLSPSLEDLEINFE